MREALSLICTGCVVINITTAIFSSSRTDSAASCFSEATQGILEQLRTELLGQISIAPLILYIAAYCLLFVSFSADCMYSLFLLVRVCVPSVTMIGKISEKGGSVTVLFNKSLIKHALIRELYLTLVSLQVHFPHSSLQSHLRGFSPCLWHFLLRAVDLFHSG